MKRLFLVVPFLLFSFNIQAQQYIRTILGDSVNKSTKLKAERFRSMWNGKIKGKRYYNEAFVLGKVNEKEYLLRYDQYADQFEAKERSDLEVENVERELTKVVTYDSLSPTTIEIGFPPRYIHRKLFFVQRKEETPIQISKRKLSKLFEKTEFNSSFLN
jgi:hypothetical protein